jgi:hypothetical protein
MYHIKSIHKNSIYLANGIEIPISKHVKNEVMTAFNKFISGCAI